MGFRLRPIFTISQNTSIFINMKKMTMKKTFNKTEERAGVWMDHHVAHIVSLGADGNYSISTIDTEETANHSASKKKAPVSEHLRNAKEQEALKAFYKTIQGKLRQFDHILLSGPTTAKSEFHHLLKKSRSFTGKRIAEMSAQAMTDRQLLAFMKKNLGKPMDIFREEEVV
jgi:stalled ribosome rescue protein Dom34